MKIYPLRLGRTKVPFGQFYGGAGGWKGTQAVLEFVNDKDHFIWVPIYAYVIEHEDGHILVDTGISTQQAEHVDYYRGTIFEYLLDSDEYDVPEGETMPEQLARYGIRLEDVRTIVLTHLHEDHVGNLGQFPEATVFLSRAEYEARESRLLGMIPLTYSRSLEAVRRWEPVDFTGGEVPAFNGSFDLLGDGRILLLPTPGHSPGSMSVLVDLDDHHALLTGDALYTLRHLAVDDVRAVQVGDESAYVESIRRMQWLRRLLPHDVVILAAHDHTEYGLRVAEALATDGRISPADLACVEQYQFQLFDPAYRLNPARTPRFVPSSDGAAVGEVV
jgi:N-acyl homoserine lactone hydrolase